ncbi:MAG TPA: DNA ligase D [Polyangiaceae bacterium]
MTKSSAKQNPAKRSPANDAEPSRAGAGPDEPSAAGADAKDSRRLDRYRDKRDPARTIEPFSAERRSSMAGTRRGRFVVHLHAATRTHYDLRLQVGGALKSFAVPRGPSLNPEHKRLSVNTEDHPIEYLDFEEVIPAGNYGAGAMIVWDTGRVQYLEGTAEEGIERGKIDFVLTGFKLNGRFALVETGKRKARSPREVKPEWLLLKKVDAHANAELDAPDQSPRSVLSGLSVEELPRRAELAARWEADAAALGAPEGDIDARRFTPMLASLEQARLDDPARLYELKLDGVRIVADKRGDTVVLRYRNGRVTTDNYPDVARAVRSLPVERLMLDGEIVTFDDAGRPNFQRIAPRIHALRPADVARAIDEVPVCYIAFDLLVLGRRVLLDVPLVDRKRLLMEVVKGRGLLRALDHLERDGRPLFDLCRAERLEGVVAKRMRSLYRPGPKRGDDWVKIKCDRDDDFVVLGWLPGKGSRKGLGALCVGSFEGAKLIFRGRVGSGMDARVIELLEQRLPELAASEYPAEGEPPPDLKEARFVRPELAARVRYVGWTEERRLRAPVFLGLRADVEPSSCTVAPPEDDYQEEPEAETEDGGVEAAGAEPSASASALAKRVSVTNRDKVFWPDEGYTKGDLCDYYAAVSAVMLPFLAGRPVVLVRYPDGIEGKNFYQWNAPAGTPDWVRTLELRDEEALEEKGSKATFLVDDVDTLVYIANLGCIPLHVLASRETSRDDCDFLTIDLDIGERPFRDAVTLALALKELLEELGLVGFAKTSGQKGLHVLIPLGPQIRFESAKLLVELIGRLLVGRHPEVATMERRVSRRGDRVYVDTGQTGASRTIVAPYSVRAVPGASVSTPLYWEEVHLALDPGRFNLRTVPMRVTEIGDPMRALLEVRPDVPAALERLGKLLS